MSRKVFILVFLLLAQLVKADNIPTVPTRLHYCGMDLYITPGAQEKMNEIIKRLHVSPEHYDLLADRVLLYMPFVEDAFGLIDVPNDLKYICILESGMVGDAVSTSNAVGFWQFKEKTGKAMGLMINEKVDERKHIWRSSFAAAKYFHRLNRIFDNWIYAIIGYNEGPTGAMKYTHKDYYGENEMIITEDIHHYAMKAIAFYIAFQPELQSRPQPSTRLQPFSSKGEVDVMHLAEKNGVDLKTFKEYNLWIRHITLPTYPPFTYYIPIGDKSEETAADPHKEHYEGNASHYSPSSDLIKRYKIVKAPSRPAKPRKVTRSDRYHFMDVKEDRDYGYAFVVMEEGQFLVDIAVEQNIKLKKLKRWNRHIKTPKAGDILNLLPPKRRNFHIAGDNESAWTVSKKYPVQAYDLVKFNELKTINSRLEPGQKVYLRFARPRGVKPTVLEFMEELQFDKTPTAEEADTIPIVVEEVVDTLPLPGDVPENYFDRPSEKNVVTKWITHTVEEGQTLWAVYKLYGMRVEMIKKTNDLKTNAIKKGQKLKIMVVEESTD